MLIAKDQNVVDANQVQEHIYQHIRTQVFILIINPLSKNEIVERNVTRSLSINWWHFGCLHIVDVVLSKRTDAANKTNSIESK